jgi:predicted transcriptional regulator
MACPTSFTLPPATIAKLRAVARLEERTYTAVVIRAIERYAAAEHPDDLGQLAESVSHHPSARKSA